MSNGVFNLNFLALILYEILGGSKFTLGGPTPPSGEFFLPKASTSQYLIVFLISTFQLQQFSRFWLSQIYVRGPVPPCTPASGKIFAPAASTLLCLMAFSISTFQLLYFPRYQGVPNLHQGALRSLDAAWRRHFFTQSEYFRISNCVFNFNILALVVFEI